MKNCSWKQCVAVCCNMQRRHEEAHCNTLQHTATHCNTLQHTATHCNQHEEANMKNHSWTQCVAVCCNMKRQHEEAHCNTLQHTATRRNQNVDVKRQINMLKRQIWKTTHGQANMRRWPLHSDMKWRLFALIYTLMRLWPQPISEWYRSQSRKPHSDIECRANMRLWPLHSDI